MPSKNLMLIVPFLPFPMESGGHQAVFGEVELLRQEFNIFLTFIRKSNCAQENLEKFNSLWQNVKALPYEPVPDRSPIRFFKRRFAKIKSRLFKNCDKYKYENELYLLQDRVNLGFAGFVKKCIAENQIDTVEIEFANSMALVDTLPSDVRKVFVHHEIRFVRIAEFMRQQKLESDFFKQRFDDIKAEEIQYLNKFDSIVTFSSVDAKKLEQAGVIAPVVTSFFMVDSSKRNFVEREQASVLSFVGPEHHTPNYLGLKAFLEKCWDGILKEVPETTLKVVGKWSEATVAEWQKKFPRVEFCGFVENLEKALAESVMIVPIDVGSGIRTKILDAAFMGVPLVSTRVGIEGIPFENECDCLVVPEVSQMKSAVVQLLKDSERRKTFARNAYEKAKNAYSEERFRESRMRAFEVCR